MVYDIIVIIIMQLLSTLKPFITAGVDQPGFQVLSGNVLLGQKREFLDFAASSGSVVSVMAADEPRTAIVQRNVTIIINGSQWFEDNPGDMTSIKRTALDIYGEEMGDPVELEPGDYGRILVDDTTVTITGTVLVQGAEDPDFSVYTFESCMTAPDGLLVNCESTTVTVYPIGSAPEIDAGADDGEPSIR